MRTFSMEYNVKLAWDDEACVWYTLESDIPGLNLEHGSLDVLIERVNNITPELIEMNNATPAKSINYNVVCTRAVPA